MFLPDAIEHEVFRILRDLASSRGLRAWVIGGFVRDHLMGRPCKDIDVVVEGRGLELAQAFAAATHATDVAFYENFGTAMVKYEGFIVEFVGARKESYQRDSRKPLVEEGSLHDDQVRRDFTINAMSISLNPDDYGTLQDPFGGLRDLDSGVLRTPTDPAITFSDDPLRMMRGIRFATQFNFKLDPVTWQAIIDNRERIKIVSQERITDELNKIILAKKPSIGFRLLFDSQLLHLIFPEMVKLQGVEVRNGMGHKDNFYHTLQVLDNAAEMSDDLWLRWSAILHDIAKPATKRFEPGIGWTFHGHEDKGARMVPHIFRNLRLPQDHKMKSVQNLVKLHLRPIALVDHAVTDSAIRRLIVEAGEDLDLLMILCRADITTRDTGKMNRYRKNYEKVEQRVKEVEERDQLRNWQPPLTGELIMQEFNLKPGPLVGIIKNAVREAIIDAEIPNTLEASLDLARKIFAQAQATPPPDEK